MKVSCIIPAYNEKSIVTTLNTIIPLLNWDLFEIIIINDCSNDQTQDILNSYPVQKNLHLIHNTNNLGKSATVARGIELAKGDYILLLDADLLHLTKQNIIDPQLHSSKIHDRSHPSKKSTTATDKELFLQHFSSKTFEKYPIFFDMDSKSFSISY